MLTASSVLLVPKTFSGYLLCIIYIHGYVYTFFFYHFACSFTAIPLIACFIEPAWGPSGVDRTQVGPMLAPGTLLSGSWSIRTQNFSVSDDIVASMYYMYSWLYIHLFFKLLYHACLQLVIIDSYPIHFQFINILLLLCMNYFHDCVHITVLWMILSSLSWSIRTQNVVIVLLLCMLYIHDCEHMCSITVTS